MVCFVVLTLTDPDRTPPEQMLFVVLGVFSVKYCGSSQDLADSVGSCVKRGAGLCGNTAEPKCGRSQCL